MKFAHCHVNLFCFRTLSVRQVTYGAIFATRISSHNKDHLGRNDRKDSHYNLITSDGSADLDLMPIRVFNRIVRNQENTMTKTPCCKTPLKLVLQRQYVQENQSKYHTPLEIDIVEREPSSFQLELKLYNNIYTVMRSYDVRHLARRELNIYFLQ